MGGGEVTPVTVGAKGGAFLSIEVTGKAIGLPAATRLHDGARPTARCAASSGGHPGFVKLGHGGVFSSSVLRGRVCGVKERLDGLSPMSGVAGVGQNISVMVGSAVASATPRDQQLSGFTPYSF